MVWACEEVEICRFVLCLHVTVRIAIRVGTSISSALQMFVGHDSNDRVREEHSLRCQLQEPQVSLDQLEFPQNVQLVAEIVLKGPSKLCVIAVAIDRQRGEVASEVEDSLIDAVVAIDAIPGGTVTCDGL